MSILARRRGTVALASLIAVCCANVAEAACGATISVVSTTADIELGTFTRDKVATAMVSVAANGTRTVPGNLRIISDESIAGRIPQAGTVTITSGTSCDFTLNITSYTNSLSNATVAGVTGTLTPGGTGVFTGTTNASGVFTFTIGVTQTVQPVTSPNTIGGIINFTVTKATGTNVGPVAGTVTTTGTAIASLTLTATTPTVTLPHIVKPTTSPATLLMTCNSAGAATLNYGANANPFAGGVASAATVGSSTSKSAMGAVASGTCAQLSVVGQSGYSFSTVVGGSAGVTSGVTLSGNCSSVGGLSVLSGGTAEIYCGANVTVGTTASTGSYSGSFPVTVTYD